MRKTMTVLCVLCVAALAAPAWGATINWEGDESKNWFTGGNWTGGSYPTSANNDYADIKNATGNYCEIANGNADARSIWVGVAGGNDGRLDILSTGTLTTQAWYPVALNNGEMNLYGNFAAGGTLNIGASGGTFTLAHYGGAFTAIQAYPTTLAAGSTLKVVGSAGSVRFYDNWGNVTYTQKTGGILEPLVGAKVGGVSGTGLKTIDVDGSTANYKAVFEEDSLLKPGFADGVTPYEDTWTVLIGKDSHANANDINDLGLKFAAGVDTSKWSFWFEDTDSDGSDDTLKVQYVPEPLTLTLLGLGGIGVLIRRRRA